MVSVKGSPMMGETETATLVSGFLAERKGSLWEKAGGDRSLHWNFLISEGFTCARGGGCRVSLVCLPAFAL